MRIALFNLDSLATNAAIRAFIAAHARDIAYVGLSPPFRRQRGGFLRQSLRHLKRSGSDFSNFLACNFLLPRTAGRRLGREPTIEDMCRDLRIPAEPVADVNAPEVAARLSALGIDLIVSCYFDQIFRPAILGLPQLGAINVHSAMLPSHRGPMPVLYCALDVPPSLGVTVHRLEASIDTGPILAQAPYAAPADATVLRSMRVLHAKGLDLVAALMPRLAAGEVIGTPQTGGSYEGFPSAADVRALKRRGVRLADGADFRAALATRVGI
jgi:methionyl-tRNA formyltransferase